MTFRKLALSAGVLAIFAIIGLSLVPGTMRPTVGPSDFAENFVAYFGCGALLTLGANRRAHYVAVILGLCACSGLMEFLQHFIPGRVSDFADLVANMAGTLVGVSIAGGVLFIAGCLERCRKGALPKS